MRLRVVPRDEQFFDLFEQIADAAVTCTTHLQDLIADGPASAQRALEAINDLERDSDEATREVVRLLASTFVTPFDREDIHGLVSALDDVVDEIDGAADTIVLHNIERTLPEMEQQVEVLARATVLTREAVGRLRRFEARDNGWRGIHAVESEGDQIYRRTMARLFSGDFKAMDVLRWKDLVDQLETALDRCETVATILESITLKHA